MNLNVSQGGRQPAGGLPVHPGGGYRQGMRPSFSGGAHPADAERLYEYFRGPRRESGCRNRRFAADTKVRLLNDGPVTSLAAGI